MIFHEKVESLLEKASQIIFPRKVDKERIAIGAFFADGFGLRIFVVGVFLKRVRKLLGTTCFCVLMKFRWFGIRNDEFGV